jgi:hypothetical protein
LGALQVNNLLPLPQMAYDAASRRESHGMRICITPNRYDQLDQCHAYVGLTTLDGHSDGRNDLGAAKVGDDAICVPLASVRVQSRVGPEEGKSGSKGADAGIDVEWEGSEESR